MKKELEALDRISNNCEEIGIHLPLQEKTTYAMFPDIWKIRQALQQIEKQKLDYEDLEVNYERTLEALSKCKEKQHECGVKLRDLKQALTPPTSDDVCKALSEYIKKPITYYSSSKRFAIMCANDYYEIARLHNNNEITFDITYCLPPHLITMIGRFYESESEKE